MLQAHELPERLGVGGVILAQARQGRAGLAELAGQVHAHHRCDDAAAVRAHIRLARDGQRRDGQLGDGGADELAGGLEDHLDEVARGRESGVFARAEVGLGLAHHLREGVEPADRADRVVDGAVRGHGEGLPVKLLEARSNGVQRVLEDGLKRLALDAAHRVLGASALGRRHGAARARHLDLARARLVRDDLDAAGRADRLLDRGDVHAEPAGQLARVLGAQGTVLDVRDDAGRGAQTLHAALGAAQVHLRQDRADRELKERDARVHQVDDRLIALG